MVDYAVDKVYTQRMTFDNSKVYGIQCPDCRGTGREHTESRDRDCNCHNESLWGMHCPAWIDCRICDGVGFIEHDPVDENSGV